MEMKDWIYVAPQRIREPDLDFPKLSEWASFEALNMQRLARIFEFKGCVGFVGSGASSCLGYPSWNELLPELDDKSARLEMKALLRRGLIDPPQAIEIAERLLKDGRKLLTASLKKGFLISEGDDEESKRKVEEQRQRRLEKAERSNGSSPFPALIDLPIGRFVTTNYDLEIEKVLAERLGPNTWSDSKSFEQDDFAKLIIFAVALAGENRQMVFHCHGILEKELERESALRSRPPGKLPRSRLVLTDTDYKHWYLSIERDVYTLQRCLDVLLQSNPLFFVGYSITDVDLLRILRRATLRWESERVASNLFLLLTKDKKIVGKNASEGAWSQAKQIKLGVNLLTYDRNKMHLAAELKERKEKCDSWRGKWRLQPKIKPAARGPEGGIQPRKWEREGGEEERKEGGEEFEDPLFSPETLANDFTVRQIDEALEARAKRSRETSGSGVLVAIIGPAGSGKLLKACQFAEAKKDKYDPLIFHAYNNDDVYSYIKRIREATSEHLKKRLENENIGGSNASGGQGGEVDLRPVLVVINNVDNILGAEPGKPWSPRNFAARGFLGQLLTLESKLKEDSSVKGTDVHIHVLITARALPAQAEGMDAPADLTYGADDAGEGNWRIEVRHPEEQPFFSGKSVGLDDENEFRLLAWETRRDYSGLILGAAWIKDAGATVDRRVPKEKLEELVRALRSNSTEIGTRVVRHIIRDLDRAEEGAGRKYETLLAFLSCFNTPVAKGVFDATLKCCIEYLGQADVKHQMPRGFNGDPLRHLLRLGLVQAVGPFGKTQQCAGDADVNYIVVPLVKRYFHQVIDRAPALSEMPGCGVHGLLSRGPFNSPGSSNKARTLFRHFAKLAADGVESYIHAQDALLKENPLYTTHYIRAMIDILRSNFACNSVPSWGGKFRDYVDMLTITIDLLRNYAVAANEYWEPGHSNLASAELSPHFSEWGIASAEEMLHLYNELGLAYYNIGSVQDALNLWELAFDWQRAVPMNDSKQDKMYAASLNSHLGMAYLQLGRMQLAAGCFEKARADACDIGNSDLESRMVGMLGRVDHFRGNVDEARKTYLAVIKKLGKAGNLRAKSYFMRHLAALYARLGDFEPARRLARESKAIAASQNAPDLVAFSSELEGRVLSAAGEHQKAIRAYHVALEEARPLDIARLNADIKLGLANLQLRLGDASSARNLAIEVMVLANENLLVLRQAKALLVIGKAAASFGENGLARSTLMHAKQLASDAGFQLVKHEAEEALVGMKVGSQEQSEAVP